MLEVVVAERLDVLVSRMASVYAEPPADPFSPEWIVVPSGGVDRWMRLELSAVLGASTPGRTDGVAANILRFTPHAFRRRLISVDESDIDPWRLARLTWSVAEVLVEDSSDPALLTVATLPDGGSLWARANRIATVFDRYHSYRPEMVRAWADGRDVDSSGSPISDRLAWQPELWRRVRERISTPSPPERFADVVDSLGKGHVPDDVPERIALFALGDLPGGASFIELVEALAVRRDLWVFLTTPSVSLVTPGHGEPHHPLLRTWARTTRQTFSLVADWNTTTVVDADRDDVAKNLLGRIQADIMNDSAPAGGWELRDDDRSVRIHRCHGESRQAEVLRDELLHIIASSRQYEATPLTEDDIVVLCPDIETFRPAIEALWGPSADRTGAPAGAPLLRYVITETASGGLSPMIDALAATVELVASRFSAAGVLDLVSRRPVMARFGFDDDDVATLGHWMDEANTRWGIDGEHRTRWGLPEDFEDSTLMMLVDRLLVGIAVADDPDRLAVGNLLPIEVEGDGIALAGEFAGLILRLRSFADQLVDDRPMDGWVDLLMGLCNDIFAADDDTNSARDLNVFFASLRRDLEGFAGVASVAVGFDDVRMVLGRRVGSTGGRAAFFRGGITVCPPTSLAGVPFRVVALLGMDETAFATTHPEGDDLMAVAPRPGDPDRRARVRQALLDAVCAAGSHLVITHNGHSVVTNQDVPHSVVLAEIEEVIADTLGIDSRDERLGGVAITHRRQAYHPDNFVRGEIDPALDVPWSFDEVARAGAGRDGAVRHQLDVVVARDAPTVIEINSLRRFLNKPLETFLKRELNLDLEELPTGNGGVAAVPTKGPSGLTQARSGENLVVGLDQLEEWKLVDRLLTHRRAGGSGSTFVQRERAAQLIGAGEIFDRHIAEASVRAERLLDALIANGVGDPVHYDISLELDGGRSLVGTVVDAAGTDPGPVMVTPSVYGDHHKLGVWVDLLALTITEPARVWCGTVIAQPTSTNKKTSHVEKMWINGADGDERSAVASKALGVVVDLYLRGTREPLPLFRKTSAKLGHRADGGQDWANFKGDGERTELATQIALGDLEYDELLQIPVTDSDPVGRGASRVERYAFTLWDAFESSVSSKRPGAESECAK